MKNSLFLLAMMFVGVASYGQHEQHMQKEEKPKEEKSKEEVKKPEAQTSERKDKPLTRTGKRVVYDLYVNDTTLGFVHRKKEVLAINGQLPAPTLYFTEGDTAIIHVHNKMHMETSIHWHGLLLPNEEDGVPYLTTAPVKGHSTHTFKFPLIQSGTYWYHSHTMVQEQIGTYGSIVIYPKEGRPEQKEHVVMLSDWTNEKPENVLRNLKRATEWYGIRKNSVQSWGEAIVKGYVKDRFKTEWMRMPAMDVSDVAYDKFLLNGRVKSAFEDVQPGEKVRLRVINGAASTYFWLSYAGGKMRVVAADGIDIEPVEVDRMLIAIAETYDIEVTIPDNMAYEFRATAQDISGYSSLFIGKGMEMKTDDLPKLNYFAMLHEMNNMMAMGHKGIDMEGKGAGQTGMAHGKVNMEQGHEGHDMKGGKNEKEYQGPKAKNLSPTPTDTVSHEGHQGDMKKDSTVNEHESHQNMQMKDSEKQAGHEGHQMDDGKDAKGNQMQNMDHSKMNMSGDKSDEVTLTYDMLRSPTPTKLDEKKSMREIKLALTGNMIRYVWSFNDKTLSQSDKILIKKGENVRMILTNNTMMRHPLHLHGHFFRFVNAQGDYSPMKHTFDVEPMSTVVIEFYANEEKDWFFHCHILYHMMSGMARVVSYENSPPNKQVSQKDQRKLFREDTKWYGWGVTKIATDGVFGNAQLSNVRNEIGTTYRVSYKDQYEFQPYYQRYIDKRQFLSGFVGGDIRNTFTIKEGDREEDRRVVVAGVRYLLPLFIDSEIRVDHKGNLRFQLSREDIPLTRRLFLAVSGNTDKEFNVDFDYFIAKNFSLHASYDSEYKYGVGLTILW
jgi:CopA family copper-resistance protein